MKIRNYLDDYEREIVEVEVFSKNCKTKIHVQYLETFNYVDRKRTAIIITAVWLDGNEWTPGEFAERFERLYKVNFNGYLLNKINGICG